MKSTKYRKWRLSKYKFPTYFVKGTGQGQGRGALVIGRTKATAHLNNILGADRVEAMIKTDTKHEWVFMELR